MNPVFFTCFILVYTAALTMFLVIVDTTLVLSITSLIMDMLTKERE